MPISCAARLLVRTWPATFALLLAAPALADEPLPPPAAYVQATPDGLFRVSSTLEPALTTIDPVPGVAGAAWSIDGFHRNVLVAEDGNSALVLPEGGNLLGSADPSLLLMTFHRPGGEAVAIALGEVMDPATLVPTASHYLWMTSAEAQGGAFVVALADGSEVRIDAGTGAVATSPGAATPGATEAVAAAEGSLPGGTGAGGCLTWEGFRASLTALGPAEPLPALPAPYAGGCVTATEDAQVDRLYVVPEGTPALVGEGPALYGIVPSSGGLVDVYSPEAYGLVEVTLARVAGTQTADFILNQAWDEPYLYPVIDDIPGTRVGIWRTVEIDGLYEADLRAALDALRGRWSEGPREWEAARERTDLGALPDGRHHLGAVPGGAGDYVVLLDKAGDRIRGADYLWAADYFGCFDAVLAPDGHHATGDAGEVAEGEAPGPIVTIGDTAWVVTRAIDMDFDPVGTLRPLPPGTSAEHIAAFDLEGGRDACLAALDAR